MMDDDEHATGMGVWEKDGLFGDKNENPSLKCGVEN